MAERGKFSRTLRGSVQRNNHPAAESAKLKVRRLVLDEIGAAQARVFDAFAGDGAMWRGVWNEAAAYVGCDQGWYRDDRLMFVADNRRVLRSIDLTAFNLFDLDAYGSPWEQALIIAARRPTVPGERIGFVFTEGSALKLKMGGYPAALTVIAGLRGQPAGGSRSHDVLTDQALAGLCRRLRVKPLRRWQAEGRTGASVFYLGLIVEGLPLAARVSARLSRKVRGKTPVGARGEAISPAAVVTEGERDRPP